MEIKNLDNIATVKLSEIKQGELFFSGDLYMVVHDTTQRFNHKESEVIALNMEYGCIVVFSVSAKVRKVGYVPLEFEVE